MNETKYKVMQVDWANEEQCLRHIRSAVFIKEQHVPEEMEWDEYDETCSHVLVHYQEEAIATGRLLENGQIGRMAVLKKYRKQGVGSLVLNKLLTIARNKRLDNIFLNAQVEAIEFYKQFGFEEEGDVFDDAGIPHKRMVKH